MNTENIVLLPAAEARPLREVREWFSDGLRLFRMRLAQWTTYAVVAIFALVLASFTGDALAGIAAGMGGAVSEWIATAVKLLLVNLITVMTQSGMFLGMTRILRGGGVQVQDMGWLFSAPQKRHLLALIVLLSLCNALYLILEEKLLAGQRWLVPDPQGAYVIDGKHFAFNDKLLLPMGGMFLGYTVLMSVLTWAVLPLMTMFADVPLMQALRYNFDGVRKNLLPLLYLGGMVLLIYLGVGMLVGILAAVMPILALPLLAITVVWALPLNNAWMYAAFRHIYTDW